jgi:dienelactone hydrolase
MRERPNRMVSKTIVPPGTVGSNPTPSALHRLWASYRGRRDPCTTPRHLVKVCSITFLVLLGSAIGGLACDAGGTGGRATLAGSIEEPASEPPYETFTREETFFDGRRDRTLVTTIHYPVDAPAPVPLIAFSHGRNGHPRKFSQLFATWAEAGYVVAAPAFPLTNDEAPGDPVIGDVVNQPADVRLVIDEMLALNDDPDDALFGAIDPEHIGAAGLSIGGWTTYGVTYHPCCRDDRIDAAIAMSALIGGFDGGQYDISGVPLLIIYGTSDPIAAGSPEVYVRAEPPKYLVTIIGGTHAAPFEDDPAPADETVRVVTTDFWDAYLSERPGALDDLVAAAPVAGLTELEYDRAGRD